jgi:hypothetical protein
VVQPSRRASGPATVLRGDVRRAASISGVFLWIIAVASGGGARRIRATGLTVPVHTFG